GWLGASSFASIVESVDHWIAFILLLIIGLKMIKEGLEEEESPGMNHRNIKILLLLSVATSIDSLAIGVSFAFLGISIIVPVIIICIMSFIFAFAGTFVGKRAGDLFGSKMEIIGGIILIGLGVKILLEHTLL
ncbi:MAG: manganese efflux pump, partial [Thermoplasmata archaeon]|nr:manganese efflux pump [Thermoplasmata archaeon]